jgi:lysozyme family protein
MIHNEVRNYGKPNAIFYTNDPDDAGGETSWGITQATARRHRYLGSMAQMPEDEAIRIYRNVYWRFNGINSQRVATKIFDMAVNFGGWRAYKLVQRALRPGSEAFQDGKWGPATEAAVNAADEEALLSDLVRECETFYLGLVEQTSSNQKFLKGWLRRAKRLPE